MISRRCKVEKKNYKKNYNLLSETKKLHNQKQSFSRQQLKEFSLLNIIIQFPRTN